jgi:hypothetical protein
MSVHRALSALQVPLGRLGLKVFRELRATLGTLVHRVLRASQEQLEQLVLKVFRESRETLEKLDRKVQLD